GYWISILLSLLTGFFVIFIGVASKYGLSLEGIDPTLSYYAIIGEVFNFPMIIIMIIALLATVISTADSFLMAGASSIVNDLIKPRVKKENEKKLLPYSRLSVLLVSVFSLLLALYIPQLVDLWVA